MSQKEITDLVGKQLALIAQNPIYAVLKTSGLNDRQWQAFRIRVVSEGLARDPFTDQVKLTPEGEEVASRSPKGYECFRRKRTRELGDTLLTNMYSRWGALATIAATLLSLWAVFKPDDTKETINILEKTQLILQRRIDSLSAQQRLLSNKQDSLIRFILKTVRPVHPSPTAAHDSSSTPEIRQPIQSKASPRKHH